MPSANKWTDIDRQLALATCHHEASHAVVAWRVGETAGFIQLGSIHCGEGDSGGMSWSPPIYDFDPAGKIKTLLLPVKKERLPKLSHKSASLLMRDGPVTTSTCLRSWVTRFAPTAAISSAT